MRPAMHRPRVVCHPAHCKAARSLCCRHVAARLPLEPASRPGRPLAPVRQAMMIGRAGSPPPPPLLVAVVITGRQTGHDRHRYTVPSWIRPANWAKLEPSGKLILVRHLTRPGRRRCPPVSGRRPDFSLARWRAILTGNILPFK